MHSAAHRGVTVVTVVMFVFAPIFKNNHWFWHQTSHTARSTAVECHANAPCPKTHTVVKKIYLKATLQQLKLAHGKPKPKPPAH